MSTADKMARYYNRLKEPSLEQVAVKFGMTKQGVSYILKQGGYNIEKVAQKKEGE